MSGDSPKNMPMQMSTPDQTITHTADPMEASGSHLRPLAGFAIEDCPLIEQPETTLQDVDSQTGAVRSFLKHDLQDCPGSYQDVERQLYIAPNADHKDVNTIVDAANNAHVLQGGGSGAGKQMCNKNDVLGMLIPPAHIGIYNHNGKTKAVGPGRWQLWNPYCQWLHKKHSINQDMIRVGNLLIIRVPQGKVGYIIQNGNAAILNVGTHVFNDGLTQFVEMKSKNETYLAHGPIHVLRVPRGKWACVWVPGNDGWVDVDAARVGASGAGAPKNAGASSNGVNLKNAVVLEKASASSAAETRAGDVKNSASASIANASLQPRLLAEGLHAIQNVLFKYERLENVSKPHIAHGSVNLLQVQKGRVARVFHDNMPRLLGAGDHAIESTNFTFCGDSNLQDKVLKHGTISIVRVPLGEIGVAWDKNQPHFIDRAGLYAFDSPDFNFIKHVSTNERVIELGAKKIVMVYTGEVGISYDHGELLVLEHGRHIIDSMTHLFEGFLSTQQKSIRLATETHEQRSRKKAALANSSSSHAWKARGSVDRTTAASMLALETEEGSTDAQKVAAKAEKLARMNSKSNASKNDYSDLMACETKDLVKVGVRADVFYSIKDPKKAIQTIRVDEIEDLVRETAIATLTNIIRSTALNEIAQSKLPSAVSAEKNGEQLLTAQATGGASAPLFFDKAHDEFLSKLHDDFLLRYGLDIANIRIESFKIMDDELAESISKQALVTAQTENELANLQGKTEIATAEQRRVAEVQNIKAQADAQALATQTNAENNRMLEQARAEAEATKLKIQSEAQAHAEATIVKARADAEALRLVAEAEALRAEQLSKTNLGSQQALLQVYSEMVQKSNEGVEKIVYCDPTLQAGGGSAFALPALQNLNRDLHALQGMGLACGQGMMDGHPGLRTASASTKATPSESGNTSSSKY